MVVLASRVGFADSKKEAIYYDHVYTFNNDIARVEKDGLFGFIDTSGQLIIPMVYEMAEDFERKGDYALVTVKGNTFVMDRQGKLHMDIDPSDIKYSELISGPRDLYDKYNKMIKTDDDTYYIENEQIGQKSKKYTWADDLYYDADGGVFYAKNADGTFDFFTDQIKEIGSGSYDAYTGVDMNRCFIAFRGNTAYTFESTGELVEEITLAKETMFTLINTLRGKILEPSIFDDANYSFFGGYQEVKGIDRHYVSERILFGLISGSKGFHIMNVDTGKRKEYISQGAIIDDTIHYSSNTVTFAERMENQIIYKVLNDEGHIIATYWRPFGYSNLDYKSYYNNRDILVTKTAMLLERDKVIENLQIIEHHSSRPNFSDARYYQENMIMMDYGLEAFKNIPFFIRKDGMGNVTFSVRSFYPRANVRSGWYSRALSNFLEILRAYSDDGNEIFNYIYQAYLTDSIIYNQKIKIGDSSIYITDPIVLTGLDEGVNDFEIHLLQDEIMALDQLDDKKIIQEEIQVYPSLSYFKKNIRYKEGNTLKQDIDQINDALGNCAVKFDENGYLGIVTDKGIERYRGYGLDLQIARNDIGKPQLLVGVLENMVELENYVSGDGSKGKSEADKKVLDIYVYQMGVFSDLVKYYAQSEEDGQAIIYWIDNIQRNIKHTKKYIDIAYNYQFGESNIRFSGVRYYGNGGTVINFQ